MMRLPTSSTAHDAHTRSAVYPPSPARPVQRTSILPAVAEGGGPRATRDAAGAVILLALCAATGCGKGEASAEAAEEPAAVRTVEVEQAEITRPIFATGMVAAKDEVPLSFKIGGIIARLDVEAGSRVPAGRVLAELDLREIDASVLRARSAADKAERDLDRARRLYEDSVFTLANLQDTETASHFARADLETALVNRAYAVIKAPAAGIILRRHAERGQMVGPGTPVVVFAGDARGRVLRVGLADRDLVRIRRGDSATIHFPALPGVEFIGRVTDISAAAEPRTGTYAVEIAIVNGDALATGLVGTAEILPADRERAALVPISAIVEADQGRGVVFTLSPDGTHALRREVTISFIHGGQVAVSGGLEDVAHVLTDGAAFLEDGAAVRIVP